MKTRSAIVLAFICACASPMSANAQTYPSKPIRMIVPFPPGGGSDVFARSVGQQLTERLGQQVVIDNRAGAQGIIGTAYAARAPADGYTVLQTDGGSLVMNPWLYKSVDYNPVKDFAHVSLATRQPVVVVLNPRVPANNLKELATLARRTPNGLTFASGGGPGHLAGELFSIVAKIRMLHVPYKGGGPAITDVAGGHVDLMFPSPPSSVPLIKSGKLRAIAVTSTVTR